MALGMSYLFVIGLVTLINGKPVDRRDGSLHIDLLKNLFNQQGTYDIDLSHHEDGPKTHHEDSVHITHYGDEPQAYEASHDNLGEQDSYLTLGDVDSLNKQLDGKPVNEKASYIYNADYSTLTEEDCIKYSKCREVKFLRDMIRNGSAKYLNIDELPNPHTELEKKFENIGTFISELRCEGNRCGRYRSNRDSNRSFRDYFRCIDSRCSLNDNRYRNGKDVLHIINNDVSRSAKNEVGRDNLLCTGNRCGRTRDDYNTDDTNNRICIGNRCGGVRGDYDKADFNNLLCTGNECGKNRENYNRADTNDRILCLGNKCGRVRGDYDKDDSNNLLCTGNRCDKNRADFNKDDSNNLLCTGNRCVRSGEDYNKDDTNNLLCTGNGCDRTREDSNNLRCTGDRCGTNREEYNTFQLTCSGNSCGKSGYGNYEDVKSKELPKLYKEIDTVISEIAEIESFISKNNFRNRLD